MIRLPVSGCLSTYDDRIFRVDDEGDLIRRRICSGPDRAALVSRFSDMQACTSSCS